jgi:hypothetical protein
MEKTKENKSEKSNGQGCMEGTTLRGGIIPVMVG